MRRLVLVVLGAMLVATAAAAQTGFRCGGQIWVVAPGCGKGGWGALCSLGIGVLVIGVMFDCFSPKGLKRPLR